MRILILNGPNLNLLGSRRPDVYGLTSLAELDARCRAWGSDLGLTVDAFQSNHEGDLIDRIHQARHSSDGLVINPGALTHYSYALHDAIEAVDLPAVEVHISNIHAREPWRRTSVTAPACVHRIFGRGVEGYRWAMRHLRERSAMAYETVSYGDGPDRVGDLRVPRGKGPHPVIALIHGGFWREQWTRDLMDAAAVDLSRRGWATWNLEYRRVGEGGGWPATLQDVAAAIDRLAALAEAAELDLGRFAVVGHSAGGHLALWAAARNHLEPGAPGVDPVLTPAAVVSLAGVSDLAAGFRLGVGDGAVEAFLRRTPDNGPKRYAAADPVALLPFGLPVLLVHGDADDRVPVSLSREFAGRAADRGDAVVYHEIEGAGHMDLIEPRSPAWQRVVAELEALTLHG
jgi:3-dehydroquinate dehydratase type II